MLREKQDLLGALLTPRLERCTWIAQPELGLSNPALVNTFFFSHFPSKPIFHLKMEMSANLF